MTLVGRKIDNLLPILSPYIMAEDKHHCMLILNNKDAGIGQYNNSIIFIVYSVDRTVVLFVERVNRSCCTWRQWISLCIRSHNFIFNKYVDILDYELWWYYWALSLHREDAYDAEKIL